jgi:hypothetical protein
MMLPRRRHLLVWAGLVAVPACGAARYAWIPGVMRGVTWTCADPSSNLAQQLRTWTIGCVVPQHAAPSTYQTLVASAGDHYLVRSVTAPEPAGEWNLMLVLDARFRASIALLGF